MHLAAERAHHLDSNYTQGRMLRYLCWYEVFEELQSVTKPVSRESIPGVSALLHVPCLIHDGFLRPTKFVSVVFQRTFLHKQVRVTAVELMNLMCVNLGLPATRRTYERFQSLRFTLGQKLTSEDGRMFWSTDSRRDVLHLKGLEGGNSLCCEAVCFVQIDNVRQVLRQDGTPDCIRWVLVRWFQPHSTAWERDQQGRPLCPGPLSINNCLWAYSRTPRPRRALINSRGEPSRGFTEQSHLFGNTRRKANERMEQEKHAYYGLVTPNSIVNTVNIAPVFLPGSALPDCTAWLETVTITL